MNELYMSYFDQRDLTEYRSTPLCNNMMFTNHPNMSDLEYRNFLTRNATELMKTNRKKPLLHKSTQGPVSGYTFVKEYAKYNYNGQ